MTYWHLHSKWHLLFAFWARENDLAGMCEIIMTLTPTNFYKSMTTHADHRIWQDVYHARIADNEVYLKLTVIDDVLIVSFKEL